MAKIGKDKLIKKELDKLNELFKDIPENKHRFNSSLLENAAFMAVSLKELRDNININGYVEEYRNGENQYGNKKRNEVELYNTMVKNYTTIIKQLSEYLPDKVQEDALLKYLSENK